MVQWLEVIKLRSTSHGDKLLQSILQQMTHFGDRRLVEMRTYRHAVLETDWALHLVWESEGAEPNGSALGHQLARTLQEFGLTDHSVWVYNHGK